MNLHELGWLAGIIDGEGSIGLYRKNRASDIRVTATLRVVNTDPAIIAETKRILDGIIGNEIAYVYPTHKERRKILWTVAVHKRLSIYKVLDAVIPYLVGKRAKAELLKQWCERRLLLVPSIGRAHNVLTEDDYAFVNKFDELKG